MPQYTIGLSVLSSNNDIKARRKNASAEAMRVLSLLENCSLDKSNIAKDAQGRPFFPGRAVDFSIAHSGLLAAVSLARGENLRAACDIERIRPRAKAPEIAENFFSANEAKYLYPRGKFDETRFYEIWTLKECFLKLRGLSVFDMAASPSFIGDNGEGFTFAAAISSPLTFRLYGLSDGCGSYILASAIEGIDERAQTQPEIRWFSQSAFDCKIIAEIKAAPRPAETVNPKR